MNDMKGRASFVKMVILTCGKGGEGVVLPVYTCEDLCAFGCLPIFERCHPWSCGRNGSGGYKTMGEFARAWWVKIEWADIAI